MKILWVSHLVPYPPKAGVLIRSHYLVKELAKHHDVHLLAFNQRGLMEPYFESYEKGTEEAKSVLGEYLSKINIFDLPVVASKFKKLFTAFISVFTKQPYTINWTKSDSFLQAMKKMHAEENYDLIHFDTISFAPYIDHCAGALTSLDHHNVESHMLFRRASEEDNAIKKWYFQQEGRRLQKIEEHYCRIVDTNITCSELDNDRFREFIPNAKFKCIPNGVDVTFFTPSDVDPLPNRLIFIGTLDWYPNTKAVRYLVNTVWPKIKALKPDLELHVIGSKPPQDIVDAAKTDKNLHIRGFVDDIVEELHKATVYVCPITDGGGTKLKLLDAFSAGKAVVADPIACEGLEATDGENVLYANTEAQYIDQITKVLENVELRKKLELNARRHVEDHFAFTSIGLALAKHYTECASEAK